MKVIFIIGAVLLWTWIGHYCWSVFKTRRKMRLTTPIHYELYKFIMVTPECHHLFKNNAYTPTEEELRMIDKLEVIDTQDPKQREKSVELMEIFLKQRIPFVALFTSSFSPHIYLCVDSPRVCRVYSYPDPNLAYVHNSSGGVEDEIRWRTRKSDGAILLQTSLKYL